MSMKNLLEKLKSKLIKNWKKVFQTYSVWFHLSNLIIAVSTVGLSALGVVSPTLSTQLVMCLVAIFAIMGIVGRMVKQTIIGLEGEDGGGI